MGDPSGSFTADTRPDKVAAAIRRRGLPTQRKHTMHANLRKVLVAVALIAPTPSAVADVITDWNEKAVALVTPRMVPPATQRAVAIVQVAGLSE